MKLHAEETLAEGLKRIAREELDRALAELEGGGEAGEAVHEVRKSLKKARAALRLVRKQVGEEFYGRENRRLRDAGRLLAPVRDADVAIATLDGLAGRDGLTASDLRPLRQVLVEQRESSRADLIAGGGPEAATAAIADARAMVDAWPIDRIDSGAFERSLEKTYKRGRKAYRKAYAKPAAARFHEVRKRVKYLWYYARILAPAGAGEIGALEDLTDEAGDLLGLDHDLAAFRELALGRGGAAARADLNGEERAELRRRLDRAIDQERLRLEWRALPLLRAIFAEDPADFAARIAARFDGWRLEVDSGRAEWLTPQAATHLRELLDRKQGADAAEQDRIRRELRSWGIDLAPLGAAVTGNGSGFEARHLDELIARGLIRVGGPADFGSVEGLDGLRRIEVEIGPNEASGICPIGAGSALAERGWDMGFWVVLDDTSIDRGIVAVGRSGDGRARWAAEPIGMDANGAATDDAEDCVRIGEWIYAFGSHYGSKQGPIERQRQFVARFRERDLGAGETIPLEVARTEYRLHRLINDALEDSGIEPFPLAAEVRDALVGAALRVEEEAEDDVGGRIEPDDLPINIEGCALRRSNGAILVGLRFPTSAAGHPLIVEIDGIERLFGSADEEPVVKGVWEVEAVGSRLVPAGIRGLAEGDGDEIEALTGNLDSAGKGSVLIEAHPEAARAPSAHFSLRLAGNRRGGTAEAELVREFSGQRRVEGVARDPAGRLLYVIDDEDGVELRAVEPAIA